MTMDANYFQQKHDAGLSYADYLATGTQAQQAAWNQCHGQLALTPEQTTLLGGFQRDIKVLAVSGIWCGDCVRQGPMFETIAQATAGRVDLKWIDRDNHLDLQQKVRINAGDRVPVVLFCSEDYELVGWYGDKPLSRYRAVARQQLGASCPLPGAQVPQNELDAELTDWVDQFERAHLILRLSARLRQKHGD